MKQSKTCKLLILIMITGINLFLLPKLLLAQQWQPQKDHIYLQEISGIIETGQPVRFLWLKVRVPVTFLPEMGFSGWITSS
jgi:hypothetical protein